MPKKMYVGLDMNDQELFNLPTPTQPNHGVTKAYADSLAFGNGTNWKNSVKAKAEVNVDLADNVEDWNPPDGVNLSVGDRVLLTEQTDPIENGIYEVIALDAVAERTVDMPDASSARNVTVFVEEGMTYADKIYSCTNDSETDIVGTDELTFIQIGSGTTYSAGDGIGFSGTIINVLYDNSTISLNVSNALYVVAGGITSTELATDSVTTNKIVDNAVTPEKMYYDTTTLRDYMGMLAGNYGAGNAIELTTPGGQTLIGVRYDGTSLGLDMSSNLSVADGGIIAAKIANGAVETIKINDGAITEIKLADDSVTSTKIAASAVNASELGTNAVETSKILDANVTTEKIADNAITTAKISDSNVTTPKIADSAITTDKLADANVTNAKLSDDAVGDDEIIDNSLTYTHILATGQWYPKYYSALVGNNSNTSIQITHNLGTLQVFVQIYKVSDGTSVTCEVIRDGTNTVTLDFDTYAPTTDEFQVIIAAFPVI